MQARRTPLAENSFWARSRSFSWPSAAGRLADQKLRSRGFPRKEARLWAGPEEPARGKSGAGRGSTSQAATAAGNCSGRSAGRVVSAELAARAKGRVEILG